MRKSIITLAIMAAATACSAGEPQQSPVAINNQQQEQIDALKLQNLDLEFTNLKLQIERAQQRMEQIKAEAKPLLEAAKAKEQTKAAPKSDDKAKK